VCSHWSLDLKEFRFYLGVPTSKNMSAPSGGFHPLWAVAAIYAVLSMSFWVYVEVTVGSSADDRPSDNAKGVEWNAFERSAWGDMVPPLSVQSPELEAPSASKGGHRDLLSFDGENLIQTRCCFCTRAGMRMNASSFLCFSHPQLPPNSHLLLLILLISRRQLLELFCRIRLKLPRARLGCVLRADCASTHLQCPRYAFSLG